MIRLRPLTLSEWGVRPGGARHPQKQRRQQQQQQQPKQQQKLVF
jgi:hypothetical protein